LLIDSVSHDDRSINLVNTVAVILLCITVCGYCQDRKLSAGGTAGWSQYSNPTLAPSSIEDHQTHEPPPAYKDSLQPAPCRQESSTSNDSYFTCCANNLTPVASSAFLGGSAAVPPTSGGGLSTTWVTVDRDTLQPSPLRQESNASNDSYVTCFSHSRSSPTPTISNGGPSVSLDSTLSASGVRLAVFPDTAGGSERALPAPPSCVKPGPADQVVSGEPAGESLIQQTLRGGLTTTWQRSSPSSRSYDEASRRRLFELYPRPLQITHISFEDILAAAPAEGRIADEDDATLPVSRYRRPADAEHRGWPAQPTAAVRSPAETPQAAMSATGQALKQAFKTHRQDGRDTLGPRASCPPPLLPSHPLAGDAPSSDHSGCPSGSSCCEPPASGRLPGAVPVSVGNAGKLRRAFFVTGKHPARRLLPEQTVTSNNQSGRLQ